MLTTNADGIPEPRTGEVVGLGRTAVNIKVRARAPGEVKAKVVVKIGGVDELLSLDLYATASGPKVKVEPKELNWGKVHTSISVSHCVTIFIRFALMVNQTLVEKAAASCIST